MQSLEAAIDVPLLDRSSKPLVPTEDGRRALECGRKILDAVDDLSSQVGAEKGLSGEFRLGVAPGLADTTLGQPLDALTRSFPTARSCSSTIPATRIDDARFPPCLRSPFEGPFSFSHYDKEALQFRVASQTPTIIRTV